MRHWFLLTAVALATAAATTAAPASAATFRASFDDYFGRATAHPSCVEPAQFVCGVGTVAGYGAATTGFQILDFSGYDPVTHCGATSIARTIELTSGAGTLLLNGSGTACFPGRSFESPAGPAGHSYGNPTYVDVDWTVVSGTGVFAHATGSGTEATKLAGDIGKTSLSGTIST